MVRICARWKGGRKPSDEHEPEVEEEHAGLLHHQDLELFTADQGQRVRKRKKKRARVGEQDVRRR